MAIRPEVQEETTDSVVGMEMEATRLEDLTEAVDLAGAMEVVEVTGTEDILLEVEATLQPTVVININRIVK